MSLPCAQTYSSHQASFIMKFIHLVTAATVVLSVFASPVAQDATPGTKDLSINTQQDLSASDVCGCLNQVAALSDDLRAQVESLTILNAPFKANVGFPDIIKQTSNFHCRE